MVLLAALRLDRFPEVSSPLSNQSALVECVFESNAGALRVLRR
jgi:hypothetical protein